MPDPGGARLGPDSCRIQVFARAPAPGRAKSRLVPVLGPDGAAALHAHLVAETVATALRADCGGVELWCTPDPGHPFFRALAARLPVALRRQDGADLGARMARALDSAMVRRRRPVLIGCDCPERTVEDLHAAAQALEGGADAVLGPAADGGYVLIGLARPGPGLFRDMPWGTSGVLQATRGRMRALGWQWHELPVRRDLDRPADLEWYTTGHSPMEGPAE